MTELIVNTLRARGGQLLSRELTGALEVTDHYGGRRPTAWSSASRTTPMLPASTTRTLPTPSPTAEPPVEAASDPEELPTTDQLHSQHASSTPL